MSNEKLEMDKAVKAVEQEVKGLREVFNTYLSELDRAKDEQAELEDKLISLKLEAKNADSLESAKKSAKAVSDLEDDAELTAVVNNNRRHSYINNVVEQAEKVMQAHTKAKKLHYDYKKVVKHRVSLNTLKQEQEDLSYIEKVINNSSATVKRTLIDVGLLEQGAKFYKTESMYFHLNSTDLYTNLETVFNRNILGYR